MINELPTLKAMVGVDGETLAVDDVTQLSGPETTAWELYLSGAAEMAGDDLTNWLGETPTVTVRTRNAEVLLVQAAIVLQFGVVTVLSPEQIKKGGDKGTDTRIRHLSPDERQAEAEQLRRRAYRMLTGKDLPLAGGVA